ncbi:hypothetical protein EDB85DRAFT_135219 [Lactarius pseudohatsudake]|nr:hypothetical protein EDB85DRAFT_135219 [Lactarius pseudohatsudake]
MANYLPVLLVSVTTNAIPDDSSLSTQPRGQVDYLSHEWREEDVWRSWRNMTRQKNEIANGVRLENASWRTWWKQRNKLKTISPETLNWLKDSDVTWLYGPLHTAIDWNPLPQPSGDPPVFDGPSNAQDLCPPSSVAEHSSPLRSKPILKHRSISDLLTSALPNFSHTDDDLEDQIELAEDQDNAIHTPPTRPPLLHTKSDTNVARWSRKSPFRKDSPPRIVASARQPRSPEIVDPVIAPTLAERSGSSDSARETSSSSQDLNVCSSGGKKKHISFNTFVRQCIAIDSPPKPRRGSLPGETNDLYHDSYDDGYEEDSEIGFNDPDDVLDEGGLFSEGHNGSDSDEEGEILEMRPSLGRSRSSSSSRSPGAAEYSLRVQPPFAYSHSPPLVRTGSSDKEHVTIAPIAPTLLKTTGVGNHFVVTDLGGRERTPFTTPVNLVYVPSFGNGYALPRKNSGEGSSTDDVYRHKGGRFSSSPGTSTSTSASSNSRSPPPTIPAAEALPIPRVLSPPILESPMVCHDDAYDYFRSTAAAQVLSADLPITMRQADLGADFGPETGALGVHLGRAVDMPEVVVVNDETGAIEERCEGRHRSRSRSYSRSRSRSHSRTPSPAEPMSTVTESDAVRIRSTTSTPPSLPSDTTHLSPPDSYPSRGRTPPGVPSRSRAPSNDGQSSLEHGRGRSATRNSSFSDRDRSSSRTSLVGGTSSPLGSVSPTGPRAGPVGNSIYSVYTQGLNSARRESESAESSKERGRGRTDHRAGVSETSASPQRKTSPDDSRSPEAVVAAVSPVLSPAPRSSPVAPSSSLPVASPERSLSPSSPYPHSQPIVPKPTLVRANITPPEDKHPRQASNTYSPSVLRHISVAVPAPPEQAPASVLAEKPQSPTLAPSARDSLTPPSSPSEHGTFVGRAAEIVSTARGLIGALWSGSNSHSPGVP